MTTHMNVNKTSSIKTSATRPRIMKVYVKSGSKAEKLRNPSLLRAAPRPEELAPGLPPAPEHDLRFRGGRTIAQLS